MPSEAPEREAVRRSAERRRALQGEREVRREKAARRRKVRRERAKREPEQTLDAPEEGTGHMDVQRDDTQREGVQQEDPQHLGRQSVGLRRKDEKDNGCRRSEPLRYRLYNPTSKAEAPTDPVPLAHSDSEVKRIVPLRDGDYVVTLSADGAIRCFAIEAGTLMWKRVGRHHDIMNVIALCKSLILFHHSLGAVLETWDAASNKRIGGFSMDRSVAYSARLNNKQFACVTKYGTVSIFNHQNGRSLGETARFYTSDYVTGGYVMSYVCALGGYENWLVCGSGDGTASVWDVDKESQLVLLRGHTEKISTVSINARMVVTGSCDLTRVHSVENGFTCFAVLSSTPNPVDAAILLGSDYLLCASFDRHRRHTDLDHDDDDDERHLSSNDEPLPAVYVTQVSTGAVIASLKLDFQVSSATTLPGGRLAVGGSAAGLGIATIMSAPTAAVDVLRAHSAEMFAEGTAASVLLPKGQNLCGNLVVAERVAGSVSQAKEQDSPQDIVATEGAAATVTKGEEQQLPGDLVKRRSLHDLELDGVSPNVVSKLKASALAESLAGYLVGYDQELEGEFHAMRDCLAVAFRKQLVRGQLLFGPFSISEADFLRVVDEALAEPGDGSGLLGQKPGVQQYLSLARGGTV